MALTLVDGNILICAAHAGSPFFKPAKAWLEEALSGSEPVGLPWDSLAAFLRLMTNPRINRDPMSGAEAWGYVQEWLDAPVTWVPAPTERHASVLAGLLTRYDLRGGLITDARLAALAVEHGLTVVSADTDFARFTEVRWLNPLAG